MPMKPRKVEEIIPISMESSARALFKQDMSLLLNNVLMGMQTWEKQEAVINAKLTISLVKAAVEDGEGKMRQAIIPGIEHKITATLQSKTGLAGRMGGQYELTFDEDGFNLKSLENNQISVFDMEETGND